MTKQFSQFEVRGIRVGGAGKIGRGVFATQDFQEGDVIEHSPILVINDVNASTFIQLLTPLGSYVYQYDEDTVCLALGYASLYNHSFRPNALYEVRDDCILVTAFRDIKAGTQIKINYNGDPSDRTPIEWGEWERA